MSGPPIPATCASCGAAVLIRTPPETSVIGDHGAPHRCTWTLDGEQRLLGIEKFLRDCEDQRARRERERLR